MFSLPRKKEKQQEPAEEKPVLENGSINASVQILDKDIAIYTMPGRFRSAGGGSNNSKKVGILIIVGGGIFFIAAAVGLYFVLFKNQDNASKNKISENTVKTEEKPAVEPVKKEEPAKIIETPKEAYVRIKASVVLAPGAVSTDPLANEIGNIMEEINGNYAILKTETIGSLRTGVVNMVKDGDSWKITDENWITLAVNQLVATTTMEETTQEPIATRPGIDSDSDDLTDKEELALGSNANQADSDGDTYPDMEEFKNLYNPAGAGKLIDNKNIIKYENKTFGFSFLYPSFWNFSTVGGDESVMIKSSDNQFMQIITQPNVDKELIAAWYAKQFSETDITPDKAVSADSWDGIKSQDGQIVYLTGKKHNYIFTISYNPGESGVLDYPRLLDLIIKTFEIK